MLICALFGMRELNTSDFRTSELRALNIDSFIIALSTDHAMVCHMGGFPTIRHNEIRDITASLLMEVCPNVAIEPFLQPLSGESLNLASANTTDGARLDVHARGFWNVCQDAYFDVRVFNPNASSNRTRSLSAIYKRHEHEKKRTYVGSTCTGHRARGFHSTDIIDYKRYGKRSANLLQATG